MAGVAPHKKFIGPGGICIEVETSPIFVKFFTPKGSYDEILATNEYVIYLQQQKRKSDLKYPVKQLNIKTSLTSSSLCIGIECSYNGPSHPIIIFLF
jgi:hypothetical protein